MPDKLPPIKPRKRATVQDPNTNTNNNNTPDPAQARQQQPAVPEKKSDVVVARRRDRKGLLPVHTRSGTGAAGAKLGDDGRSSSPAQAGEEKRLSRVAKARSNALEAEQAMFSQRENGFRYNAFQAPGVFSTFTADTLVLADRDRKFVEVAVSRRRAQIEHDRKQREIARADELRRRKAEQERVQKQHDLRRAQDEAELRRQQEDAAKARKNKAASHTMAERRRKEIEDARALSERREAHRATRRDGKDPHLEAEMEERQRGGSPTSSSVPGSPSPRQVDDANSNDAETALSVMLSTGGWGRGGRKQAPDAHVDSDEHAALSLVLAALSV